MTELIERLRSSLEDRYRIERELGSGGMATVYLAEDLKHQRPVAIKVLRPELSAVLGLERFEREIATVARLTHPHILALHDSGAFQHEGQALPYYVMPYVAGDTLRHRLTRERAFSLPATIAVARGVASALDCAHREGILHRDLKPENILLVGDEPLVADFGIARAVDAAAGDRLTETGLVLGTAAYMSPEQAAGDRDLDARSDQYSLACVVYELIAGQTPFTGPTLQSVMAQRLTRAATPLSQLRDTVPLEVDEVMGRAMARNPADRFPAAEAFVEALAEAAGSAGIHITPRSASSVRVRQPWPRYVAAGLGVALLAAAGFWMLGRGTAPPMDANLVAVAPFDVFEPSLEVYREGFVDLLARSLDGAGPLRTVAPTTAIRRWKGRSDRASGVSLGRATGAELVVIGQVAPSGQDSVRITASLVDAVSDRTVDQVQVRGPTNQADELADSVTVGLLGALARIRTIAAARSTSLGTRSLPALRAFLQGEQFYRRAAWDSARPYYDQAVEHDSGFGLAWYRVGVTAAWQGRPVEEWSDATIKALSLNTGLAPRESLMIQVAGLDVLAGDASADSAFELRARRASISRQLTQRYSDDPEAWFNLGELLYHAHAGTAAEDIQAFRRSIDLDPDFAPAYFHILELALHLDQVDSARQYARRFVALNSEQRDEESDAVRLADALLNSPSALAAPDSVIDRFTVAGAVTAAQFFRRWPDSGEVALHLARRLPFQTTGTTAPYPTFRQAWLTLYLTARGHLREAAPLANPAAGVFSSALADLALTGVLPAEQLAGWKRDALLKRKAQATIVLPIWAAERDTASLLALRRSLGEKTDDPNAWGGRRMATYLTSAAQAWLLLTRGDSTQALAAFQALPDSLCTICPFDRLKRAELLAASGADTEAIRFLDQDFAPAGSQMTISEVLWILLRGRVAERLNQREKALKSYQYVADFWRHADPELAPYVTEAREGLARLTAERKP